MTYWLVIIFALVALACRDRIMAVLRWHPLAMVSSVLIIALVAGWVAMALWALNAWGSWGAFGTLCSTGLCVVALRLYTGRWYWQDDDTISLD